MQLQDLITVLKAYGTNSIHVTVEGRIITIELPDLSSGIAMWRRDDNKLQKAAQGIHQGLASVGMDVEVRVRGLLVARMGAHAHPNILSNVLGFSPLEVIPSTALRSFLP